MAVNIARPSHEEYIRGMQEYTKKLMEMDREQAKKYQRKH